MQWEIFQAICRMGIFVICAQSIVHFRPNASYEKYLKMLVSVMILIQLFLPIGKLIWGEGAEEFEKRVEEFERSLDLSKKEAEENAAHIQEKLEGMTLEEVQEKLEGETFQSGLKDEADSAREREGETENEAENEAEIKRQDVGQVSIEVTPIENIEPLQIDAGQ